MPELLSRFKSKKKIEVRVLAVQDGNDNERNQLLGEYAPFIKKVLSQHLGRFIEEENDVYYSVGLMAFNEAIDHYARERGAFLTFATTVIRNRAVDQFRKEKNQNIEMPFSSLDGSDDADRASKIDHFRSDEGPEANFVIREEMQMLVQRLNLMGISMDDLIAGAPKHEDTRRNAVKIARFLYEHAELRKKVFRTRRMPAQELRREFNATKKILDRSRKFILAVMLILDSDLDTMKHYIQSIEKEGSE